MISRPRRELISGLTALALVAGIVGPAGGARAAHPAAGITLTWIVGDSGSGAIPYSQIIKQYEALHPSITIALKAPSPYDYYGGLLTASTGAAPPDLVAIGDSEARDFVGKKALTDLTPLIRAGGFNLAIYLPNLLTPGRVNGDLYLLPKDYTPFGVYYNKKLFDAVHAAYPKPGWTWQQFLATAKRLTHHSPNYNQSQYGVQGFPLFAVSRGFEALAASTGARLISPDGKKFVGYLDSPAAVRALQFYGDLYGTYGVAAPANFVGVGEDYFARGKAAMAISGHWFQKSYLDAGLKLGLVGMPRDKVEANAVTWSGWGIPAGSKHVKEAFQFLEFVAGKPGSLYWKKVTLSPVAASATSPLDQVWAAQTAYLKPIIAFSIPDWSTTGAPAIQDAMRGAATSSSPGYAALMQQAARTAQINLDFTRKK